MTRLLTECEHKLVEAIFNDVSDIMKINNRELIPHLTLDYLDEILTSDEFPE